MKFSVIEVFEESEGRKHGECSLLDLARVLEIKKQLCEANVSVFSCFIII